MPRQSNSIKTKPLFNLPFASSNSTLFTNSQKAEDYFSTIIPTLTCLASEEDDRSFLFQANGIIFDDLAVASSSTLTMKQECGITEDYILTVPFQDSAPSVCITDDGRSLHFSAKDRKALLFVPSTRGGGTASHRSSVAVRFCHKLLLETLKLMTGNDKLSFDKRTSVIDLGNGPNSSFHYFASLMTLLDSVKLDREKAKTLGIDDSINRFLAYIIFPEYFTSASDGQVTNCGPIDYVCDAIRSRISSPLSLSEMQLISGLTARQLQRLFYKKFGCSPTEWQQRERLYVANHRLMSASEKISITHLALEVGFSSTSRFIDIYKRYFGETPGQTLLHRGNR